MKTISCLVCLVPLALCSCAPKKAQPPGFQPGLGELMSLNQMRHAKLGLAGMNQNWELAAYELDELKEGFEDVLTFYPTAKQVPQPLTTLVPALMNTPFAHLEEAITAKDEGKFMTAYEDLTNACNSCHQASNRGFIAIKQPDPHAYTNQDFLPRKNNPQ